MITDSTANEDNDFIVEPFRKLFPDPRFEVTPAPVHRGGANVLFGDGHVKWHLVKELIVDWPLVPQEMAKQRMWNADNEPSKPW